jgi:hypothetical protein
MKFRLVLPLAIVVAVAAIILKAPAQGPETIIVVGEKQDSGSEGGEEVRTCGTVSPNLDSKLTFADAVQKKMAALRVDPEAEEKERNKKIVIPVRFHVIHSGAVGQVTNQQLNDQIAVLNRCYDGQKLNFVKDSPEWLDVAKVNKPKWFTVTDRSDEERELKREAKLLHPGDPKKILNVYTAQPKNNVLGWATFPWDRAAEPWRDGVVIHSDTLPGGKKKSFNQGKTCVHEIGHWLGLYHTFEGGCDPPGDQVDDTPYQAVANYKCDPKLDTCREHRGFDPVDNFMNYTPDACMKLFTSGQAERVRDHILFYRSDL